MIREPHIPLFLWVATALVVHGLGGGGATEVAKVLEEKLEIRSFAKAVRGQARLSARPFEVELVDAEEDEAIESPEDNPDAPQKQAPPSFQAPEAKPDPIAKQEPLPPEKAQAQKDVPDDEAQKADEAAQKLMMVDNRRISVQQHVQDENQEDNPDASFAAEHANHVEEETQARITAMDQNDPEPTPGGNHQGEHPEPGNAEEHEIAQSEESPGEKDIGPGEAGVDDPEAAAAASASLPPSVVAQASPRVPVPPPAGAPAPPPPQQAEHSAARDAMPETLEHSHGSFGIAPAQEQRAASKKLPPPKTRRTDMLGFGSAGTTQNGVNLNLSHTSARAIVGADALAQMRRRAGEKRLSKHRGSWKNVGIEKWRASIENYVSTVKPGNQTALNTARVPWSRYLNQIHNRLHSIFADGFLRSLDGLPADHPLNDMDMSTHMEIALNRQDGTIVKLGITKSSGVTMFDVGALEAVKKASPYGVPPGSIISSDGNVYLHWEFHRKPMYACSTYFARPFILNLGQKQAPPSVAPPSRPEPDERPANQRRGSFDDSEHQHPEHAHPSHLSEAEARGASPT